MNSDSHICQNPQRISKYTYNNRELFIHSISPPMPYERKSIFLQLRALNSSYTRPVLVFLVKNINPCQIISDYSIVKYITVKQFWPLAFNCLFRWNLKVLHALFAPFCIHFAADEAESSAQRLSACSLSNDKLFVIRTNGNENNLKKEN